MARCLSFSLVFVVLLSVAARGAETPAALSDGASKPTTRESGAG